MYAQRMLVIKIIGALLWIKSGEVSNLLTLYICIYCTKCLDLLVKCIFPHSSANFLYGWKTFFSRHIHSKRFNFYTPVPAPRRVRFQNPSTETILTTQKAYLKFREIQRAQMDPISGCCRISVLISMNQATGVNSRYHSISLQNNELQLQVHSASTLNKGLQLLVSSLPFSQLTEQ